MIYLQQVSIDAKNQFFNTFLDILSSIKKHDDYRNFRNSSDSISPENLINSVENNISNVSNYVSTKNEEENHEDNLTKRISDNNISLICSDDVYNLLIYLFNDGILDFGFLNLNLIETEITRQSKGLIDQYELPKVNEVFMIRPTFKDSQRLSVLLQTRHTSVIRVVCLPEICEMYPEILSHLLGKNFTVSKYGSNTPYTTNLVELFPCSIHMVPVDGVLSMVMTNCFSDFYLHGDPTTAWFFSKSFEYLEKKHLGGAIPYVVGLGILSKYVLELLLRSRREIAANVIVDGIDRVQNEKCFIPLKLLESYHDNIINDFMNKDFHDEFSTIGNLSDVGSRVLLTNSSSFKSSIIIDRKVDLITPMCTNFTYEGLLDSVFGLVSKKINVDTNVLDGKLVNPLDLIVDFQKHKQRQSVKKSISLNSKLYYEIRWLDFSKVGSYLHEKALRVKKGYEGGGMQTIGEMGEFVKKFKSLQQEHVTLSTHVNVMGYLNSYVKSERFQLLQNVEDSILQGSIDGNKDDSRLSNISKLWAKKSGDPFISQILDLIFWNIDVNNIFRLVILLSQTMDGIKQPDFNTIRKSIVYQYGFTYLKTLQNLTKSGLIKINNMNDSLRWQKMCGKFNLLVDSELSKSDCSGIFGGYAPLSIRIAQLINVSNDCTPLNPEFSLLNAQIVSTRQKSLLTSTNLTNNITQGTISKENNQPNKSGHNEQDGLNDGQLIENCLLCYIGGITLGEVASVSFLNSFSKTRYLVLTTEIINSKQLINM